MRFRLPLLLVALLLWPALGCQATGAGEPTSPRTIAISITDEGVTPSGEKIQVAKGTEVVLEITTTHDDILHVHGYDTELHLKAGESTTHRFVADKVGRWEIETHSPVYSIAALDVR